MKLKFITVNLWLGGMLFDEVLDFLKAQDADVIVLQEAYNGENPSLERRFRSMEILRKELGYPYEDFVPDYRDFDELNGEAQRGNGLLSKFPITARRAIYFGAPYSETYRDVPGNYQACPRDLQHVTLKTPAGEVNVFNIQGVWDLNGENYSAERRKMAQTVLEATRNLPNVILGGDTNAQQTNQAIYDIEQSLHSVFGRDLPTTFNMKRKDNPGYATAAVDAIFVGSDVRVVNRACYDLDLSDHLPLGATLEITRRRSADT